MHATPEQDLVALRARLLAFVRQTEPHLVSGRAPCTPTYVTDLNAALALAERHTAAAFPPPRPAISPPPKRQAPPPRDALDDEFDAPMRAKHARRR